MRALIIEGGQPEFRRGVPRPQPLDDEVSIRVLTAGVCATDLALVRGYMNFSGVPGHEFVGIAQEGRFKGRRVVGEINASCGTCESCLNGMDRHCSTRTVLGILGRSGAFAEEITLPESNLHPVPDGIPTDVAVFAEPLAAACQILEQIPDVRGLDVLVAGDGRLGLLCALVLHRAGAAVTVAGRHPERTSLLPSAVSLQTRLLESAPAPRFDLAVEATGSAAALPLIINHVRPRGTVVLKTTSGEATNLDLAPLVINEITVVGSRCGRFGPALRALKEGTLPVEKFIAARFPLEDGVRALEVAGQSGVLKVLLDVTDGAA